MTAQTFTVFAEGGMFLNNACSHAGFGLQELIDLYISHYRETPIAWAGEWTIGSGGRTTNADLRAESIAAGRVIDCINGVYVPRGLPLGVAEEAPKTTGQFYDEGWNAAHDGLPFDSKATRAWRDGWNDYQDADPAHKIRLDGELAAAVRECITPEPQRPELTWATPKPVDRWEGFTTNYNTEPQFEGDTHPLQRITDPSDPLHGSAFLRG